jgi:hypothetical protein
MAEFSLVQVITGHEGICFSSLTAALAEGILEKSEYRNPLGRQNNPRRVLGFFPPNDR